MRRRSARSAAIGACLVAISFTREGDLDVEGSGRIVGAPKRGGPLLGLGKVGAPCGIAVDSDAVYVATRPIREPEGTRGSLLRFDEPR